MILQKYGKKFYSKGPRGCNAKHYRKWTDYAIK